jgi:hypothetical protein
MINAADVQHYAGVILDMIKEDQVTGQVPGSVSSWDELDETVDANDYYRRASLPSGTPDAEGLRSAVNDEVIRRLTSDQGGGWGVTWMHPDGHEVNISRTIGYATRAQAEAVGREYAAEHGGAYQLYGG